MPFVSNPSHSVCVNILLMWFESEVSSTITVLTQKSGNHSCMVSKRVGSSTMKILLSPSLCGNHRIAILGLVGSQSEPLVRSQTSPTTSRSWQEQQLRPQWRQKQQEAEVCHHSFQLSDSINEVCNIPPFNSIGCTGNGRQGAEDGPDTDAKTTL